ncbi:UBX domain-containing protein 6-like [Clytia hemisphaerica]
MKCFVFRGLIKSVYTMNKLKSFFERKKLDNKFKQIGSGHTLSESRSQDAGSSRAQLPTQRQIPSSGASRAGEAALARLQQQHGQPKKPSSSTATWKHKSEAEKMKQEMLASDNATVPIKKPATIVKDHSLAVDGLFYNCPVYPACLPWGEIHDHLHQCLLRELPDEPLMISVTMIHTLNRDKVKKEACITILSRYIQNILDHPGEEKYRKIRKGNKVFQEKVQPIIGVEEFLTKGAGFQLQTVDNSEAGTSEEFYVMSEEIASNIEQIQIAKEMLAQAEGLEIILDRNLKVFTASAKASQMKVPDSFFNVSSDEVKQTQMDMTNTVEKSKELRTKAMRDGDNGPKRIYRYCIIRVRFPDGLIIQGTFKASEKLSDVKNFVRENLALDWLPFDVVDTIGKPFSKETESLSSLKLTPAALLNFRIDQNVNEIAASSQGGQVRFLKEDVMILLQEL